MAKKKKDKKASVKRREKSREKKKQKRKLRLIKSNPKSDFQFAVRPAIGDMETPDGFRPISISQAMVEYGKPLEKLVESDDLEDFNEVFQIATMLWNYSIIMEGGKENEKTKREIVHVIKSKFGMDTNQAIDLLNEMTERKTYLFPPEIQSKSSMMMFIRKGTKHLITPFNYKKLKYSDQSIGPNEKDEKMIAMINKMDSYLHDGVDYGEWEDHYFSMEEQCNQRFKEWLSDKGLNEYRENFSFYTETFLDFVYRYIHNDPIDLKMVSPIYVEEFFTDYVLRKVMVEPHEYANWPPALKLFYSFLSEKGYLRDPVPITDMIDEIEPHFIEILRARFS